MEIIKPTAGDIPALLELWRRQYEYHHDIDAVYYVPHSEDLRNAFEKYLTKTITEHTPHILVAKDEAELVGFVTFTEGEDDYFDAQIKKYGQVIELYVSGEARGKGAGKLLMEAAEDFFRSRGLADLKLSCSLFNKNALDFYEHIGYVGRQVFLFKKL